jgi:GNAT superfamily N-acetyltransferase
VTPSGSPSPVTARSLCAAIYANQREWVRRAGSIDAAGHPRGRFERDGIVAVRTGTTGAIVLPPPDALATPTLGDALTWLRRGGDGDVLVWSEMAARETDRLVSAHGARESFVPRWMSRPLDLPLPELEPGPATVRPAEPSDLTALLHATELPYASPWQAHTTMRLATRDSPETVALLLATVRGVVVGRVVVSLCDTPVGVTAGVYDLGVVPRWQRQGIGRHLMRAVLAAAREREAALVTLNATPAGVPLYLDLGFEDVGEGQTWLLPASTVREPPSATESAFALAISGGDALPAAPALARRTLANGDTPLGHAARFDQPESARRLLMMGTMPDVAALWQLGLMVEARALMRLHPAALDIGRGTQGVSAVHVAIYWDDLEFLEEVLAAGADPHVRDGTFDSDAWGWAHALGNDDALDILNERFPDGDWSPAPDNDD